MNTPNAIITADWHIMDKIPKCRTDDFIKTMKRKIDFVASLQRSYNNIPILCAGDLLDAWKSSPEVLAWSIRHISNMYVTIGQHEMPYHNIDLLHKSGLEVLDAAGTIKIIKNVKNLKTVPGTFKLIIKGFHWGASLEARTEQSNNSIRQIALCHILTYTGKKPWPDIEVDIAHKLFERLKGYDLIVTGDNHKPFVLEHKGRLLVNPGSIFRLTADQIDHKPRVYLYYVNENKVKPVYIPIEKDVVNRDYIEEADERNARLDAFVERVLTNIEIGHSFEANLDSFFKTNKTRKRVKEIVYEAIEGNND